MMDKAEAAQRARITMGLTPCSLDFARNSLCLKILHENFPYHDDCSNSGTGGTPLSRSEEPK
jgi:hypothetical protein